MTTITFIGAGSTVFTRNIAGDILNREALSGATIRLMDIDPKRLAESEAVVGRMVRILDVPARVETHADQRAALDGADFVVVCFQIGGYDPCTITDFEVPKRFGLRQTIADTLGIGGIMRGLRTVPHLWSICEDMLEVCPDAIMLQYVNPMAINTWAIGAKYPAIAQVGLCHSVQGTAAELAADLRGREGEREEKGKGERGRGGEEGQRREGDGRRGRERRKEEEREGGKENEERGRGGGGRTRGGEGGAGGGGDVPVDERATGRWGGWDQPMGSISFEGDGGCGTGGVGGVGGGGGGWVGVAASPSWPRGSGSRAGSIG